MDTNRLPLQKNKSYLSNQLTKIKLKQIKRHWQLYLIVMLPLLYLLIFKYIPMYGALIAFKDFNAVDGILGSPWAGWKHFEAFFTAPNFWPIVNNTLLLGVYGLLVGFPAPIILALALNEIRNGIFKKSVQMITFAPYFISTVVVVSMIILFTSPRLGIFNHLFEFMGFQQVDFMGIPQYFSHIFVWSDVWQNVGYGAVIYLAALSGVNPQLYEAARVDGATRLQKIIHIDLPSIMPTVVILLILNVGQFMKLGFEKIYLMQNNLNLSASEVLQTYVFKVGIEGANFSFASAVGLFNSVINLILLLLANYLAKRVSESSLW
ncbi:ABC transporter permease subunit [Gracilibacillus sp. YIM 98692]|uniref:ABC transporter permease n=1 Tax=Gracilibacillus sp. YIM 98692 TaxID=2663532 RepID=UPI0013D56236|nr:ABC transporter permease subunit [Gracilibacillus sp. YIM 98692]